MKNSGPRLYRKAKSLIPGGTQLLSKRPEMFLPDRWPAYYSRARGADIWDLDGRKYLDMSYSGIGACLLGYADPDVDRAVRKAVQRGSMCTLNSPEEVELAELLLEIHPWAEKVRYARTGGEVMAMAVRIARAATGRDIVAFCGYHGWHDWYLSANLAENSALDGHLLAGLDPAGVPRGLLGTALPFHYNRIEELESIVRSHGSRLAAVVMEPIRHQWPQKGFLENVRRLAKSAGAVLIFDEVTSGWRLTSGGAHLALGVSPDMAVFAKGMSNGYPMAAVIGVAPVMEAVQKTFVSSTYWTERIGPAAAIAAIEKNRRRRVPAHLARIGRLVQEAWRGSARRWSLPIEIDGTDPLSHFTFRHREAQALRTLFTRLMLERKILAVPAFYAMFAHTEAHVRVYAAAVDEVFRALAKAAGDGSVRKKLKGAVAHSGFQRLA